MFGGLRRNLIAAIVTTTAALVLSILLLEDPLVEYRATAWVREALAEAAEQAAGELSGGADPDAVADRVGAASAARLVVYDAKGRVVGDTAASPEAFGTAPVDEELLDDARARGRAIAIVPDGDGRRVQVAIPAGDGRVVRASRSLEAVEMARDSMRELLIVGGVMAVAIAALLTLVLSRTMVRPVQQLTEVAGALATGDLSVRTHSRRADELGILGRALDGMADQLAERLQTLRAEEARLRTVLDSMVEAVFVTDREGRIVLTNRALDRMVGKDARGRTAVEAIRSAELHQAVRGARKGRAATVDLQVRTAGETRDLSAQVAPLPDQAGVVAVLHDVTDLKLADRVRRDFVANASHELRTPLTAVRGFAETLRDGVAQDPGSSTRFADMIVKHTLRLQRLVDDLLELSRAESPGEQYAAEPVDAGRIAADVVRGLASQAEEKQLTLEAAGLSELPMVRASERALDQVLVNLVDNAVKYTPSGGRVTVRGRREQDRVVIEVHDTGPGISPKHLERIFERFYRVDKGRSREVGGTGLGLSIVKHLAARMGAELDVNSTEGRGSTFRVALRHADAEQGAAASVHG